MFHRSLKEAIVDQMDECRLEMSLLLPAALLDQPRKPNGDRHDRALRVESSGQGWKLTPVGDWEAETILEGLPKGLSAPKGISRLNLDLTHLVGFDQLSLSALIVVLRNHAARFKSIVLAGLPSWASARIHHTGAENLLGFGWSEEPTMGGVCFHFGV